MVLAHSKNEHYFTIPLSCLLDFFCLLISLGIVITKVGSFLSNVSLIKLGNFILYIKFTINTIKELNNQITFAFVAQGIEHPPPKGRVARSNRAEGTTTI